MVESALASAVRGAWNSFVIHLPLAKNYLTDYRLRIIIEGHNGCSSYVAKSFGHRALL